MNDISKRLLLLIKETKQAKTSQRILESLYFKYIKVRQADIIDAYARTFQWIFKGASADGKRSIEFLDWLESGSGIYWIAGKAGSGKSTLMKFLCGHESTRSALKNWAGGRKLVTASYFFWNSGNQIQKSREGLLRSLLYQILRQYPALISIVCSPRRFSDDPSNANFTEWTYQELFETFERLVNQTLHPCHVCCFVDGLDEYDGEHIDIVKILLGWANSDAVKVCVSSRPWNVFEKAFGSNINQKLLLQHLTGHDISIYVSETLKEDPSFLELMKQDSRYMSLILDIVEKARGVFLWVYLVVRSLLRGLTNDDDITTLRKRLNEIPSNLEDYFEKIVKTVEPVYREDTSRILLVAAKSSMPLSLITFHFLKKDMEDPNYALKAEIKAIPQAELKFLHSKLRRQLNACCKDLLELETLGYADLNLGLSHRMIINIEDFSFLRYKIDFLHLTVKDFLTNSNMQRFLRSRTSPDFDANVTLCRAALAQVKLIPHDTKVKHSFGRIQSLALMVLHHAYEVEICNGTSEIAVLDELQRVLSVHDPGPSKDFYRVISTVSNDTVTYEEYMFNRNWHQFIKMAIDSRLLLYVTSTIDRNPQCLHWDGGVPLLHHTLQVFLQNLVCNSKDRYQKIDVEMVRMLLDRGADPNQKLINERTSVWGLFLKQISGIRELRCGKYYEQRKLQSAYFDVTALLLQRGADPDLDCEELVSRTPGTTIYSNPQYSAMSELFGAIFGDYQCRELEALRVQNRSINFWKWIAWGVEALSNGARRHLAGFYSTKPVHSLGGKEKVS